MKNFDGLNTHTNTSPIPSLRPNPPVKKKKRFWKWFFLILILLAGVGAYFGSTILSKTNQIFTGKANIFTRVGRLLSSEDVPLKGEELDRVNVLLLGMGGPGHDGPLLTDTMIVASLNTTTSEVSLVSIPRDFMITLNGRGYNKINAAYAYAEMDQEGSGGTAAIKAAEEVTGLSIPYYAAIDFAGFVKAVDHVGGLDIDVETTFTDSTYPNYNKGYLPPQTFTKGGEHMAGERALIFARSRHGNNGEGSDFARSTRQKKIMLSFKNELMQLNITNLSTLNNLLSTFTQNFRTNMEPHELKRLADIGGKVNGENVFSISLDPQSGVICDSSVDLATGRPAPAAAPTPVTPEPTESEAGEETDGESETAAPPAAPVSNIVRAYVVLPCSGKTMTDVHNYLTSAIKLGNLSNEAATIEVQNASGKTTVTKKWQDLANYGVTIKFSTSKTPIQRSILYDNTKGAKPKTLEHIKSQGTFTVSDLPYTQSTSDFVIILGQDAQ